MLDQTERRIRYAKEDNAEIVASMLRTERVQHTSLDEEYAANVMKAKTFDTNLDAMDDLADILADKPVNKESKEKLEEKQRRREIQGNTHDNMLWQCL
jgi:hypothetical protein